MLRAHAGKLTPDDVPELERTIRKLKARRKEESDRIDYRLEWTPESNACTQSVRHGVEVQTGSNSLTLVDAVCEQLGLKLQPNEAPVQILVIDHLERPSEI